MNIKIDKPYLLKEAMTKGINLFTGAGFSKLPDSQGRILPEATELCNEICERFSINKSYSSNLEQLSSIVNLRAKQQFQKYLREKYTITEYNSLYDCLNNINIHSYITTNIDNIIQCVMDNSKKYYLQDITFGAAKRDGLGIPYIPLHGEVNNEYANLYFGRNELANVDSDNKELFSMMHAKLLESPTLFIGYGFHDNAIERTIAKILETNREDIWIQCMPGNQNIDYFRDLGCYVIEGSTEDILKWIKKEFTSKVDVQKENTYPLYKIPTRNQLEMVSLQDYFLSGKTHWYCVLSGYAYETKSVNDLYETLLVENNVIAVGIPFSGKTTMLMQLASKMKTDIKLYISDFTFEQAKLVANNFKEQKSVVFIDNCCEDIEAIKLLMKQRNIKVVGVTDDYAFESAKHLIADIEYKKVEIGELEVDEAQKIYEKIPIAIRKEEFSYKQNQDEKYSMLEMMSKNVKGVLSKERVHQILMKIKSATYEGYEIVAMTAYLCQNKSVLNMDIICSYFNTTDYKKIQKLINATQGYLSEIAISLTPDIWDQNYYNMRSNLFAHYAMSILTSSEKEEFGRVVRKFILNVSPYKIYRHYIFKRSAYDARMFYELFGDSAHDLYESIYQFDSSEYTLQQWALYKAYLKDYSGAFADIDKAINMNQNNFSIKNTRAIILFEANKDKKTQLALKGMAEAMETLQKCFDSDKRRVYHAKKYSEFAIFLAEQWKENTYLRQAEIWLNDIVSSGESTSASTKRMLRRVRKLL